MRLNMTQQGGLVDEFVSGGGNVLNPLILMGNPTSPLEAATKQYVDNSLMSLNANNLINGVLPGNRLPAMNGDLVSNSGSNNLILNNTGVTAGTYAKVSVNNKGRITNGLTLVESDIPAISWNKITSDKPTTLAGYGITDALPVTGGTMTGQLLTSGTPTAANQLVNKSYVDSVIGSTVGIAVGDIICKIDPATPVGFLRCNGAEVDKTTYSELYNAIGDRYTLNGKAGNGQPWRNQYDINFEDNGDLLTWRAIQSLPGILGVAATFVTKNRVYVCGGYNGSSYTGTVYSAQINNDGTLGAWVAGTALPGAFGISQAIVVKNKVYLLGGQINGSSMASHIYVADINADGTIGSWSNGTALPSALSYSHSFVNNNRIYVVGGYNGSVGISAVYSSIINTDGTLSAWVTEASLPTAVYSGGLVVIKNRVYLLGGQNASTAATSIIYSAILNSDGSIGTWQVIGSMPVTMALHQTVVTRNNLYVIGGSQSGTVSSNVYKVTINADGTLGTWQLMSTWPLPGTLQYSNITVTRDRMFVIGGHINGAWSSACWMADMRGGLNDYSSFYSNEVELNYMVAGSCKPWQQQYQNNITQSGDITGWVTDSSVAPNYIFRSAIAITKDTVYLIGGWSGSAAQNFTYSAPINADGSLGTWTAGGNFPVSTFGGQMVVIGNKLYYIGGSNNSTYYASVYMAVINSDGTLGSWNTVNSLPGGMANSQCVVTRNRIYLLGGYNGSYASTVYTAMVFPDGSIGAWSTGTSLPYAVCHAQAFITKNRVYLIGGQGTGNAWLSNVYTAPINADGTIGAWAAGTSFPITIGETSVYVTKNNVYVLGGWNGTAHLSTVYRASINSDGIIGTWSLGTSLPNTKSLGCVFAAKNKLYLVAGATTAGFDTTIFSAPILEGLNDYSAFYAEDTVNYLMPGSGRPWQQQYQINNTQTGDISDWVNTTPLPVDIAGPTIATKNRVYILGGTRSNSTTTTTIYTAPINSDGTLGTWVTDGVTPMVLSHSQQFIVTKNRVYIFGGYNGSAFVTNSYYISINADGTLGSWVAITALPVIIYAGSCFITKNRVYICGGTNGTSAINTIYSAVINSDGSIGGWTLSSVTLPVAMSRGGVVLTKNRVYILGGATSNSYLNTIYTARILPDGTIDTFTSAGTLPSIQTFASMFVTSTHVYSLSGTTVYGADAVTNVYRASINADGTLGTWTTGTPVVKAVNAAGLIVTNNKIYLIGGGTSSTFYNNVQVATISGGMNDYSPYYNGDISPIEQFVTPSRFKLPDATFSNDNLNYFIKF